jgi:hypothetical protein
MSERDAIIVSAENNPYMAWQAKLLHCSCLRRLKQAPTFIVHDTGGELHPGFRDILKTGGSVFVAPNYKATRHGDEYTPKNLAGTLMHASSLCAGRGTHLVLCDPDMNFVRPPLFPETLSGDYCSYINFRQGFVETAVEAFGVSPDAVAAREEGLRCGGPYVVPAADAGRLAEAWIEAVDSFPPRTWEDVMYAFGLASVKLGMPITLTRMVQSNYQPDEALQGDVIHYCYGNEVWSKRHYFTEEQSRLVWEPRVSAPRATVLGEILAQIDEAREFYLTT